MKEQIQSIIFLSSVKAPGKGEVSSIRSEDGANGHLEISLEGGVVTLDDGKATVRVPLTNVRSWVPKAPTAAKEPKK